MSLWLRLLLSVISFYSSIRMGVFAYDRRSLKVGLYSVALFFLGLHQTAVSLLHASELHNVTLQATNQISDWSSITAIAFALCGLVHLIRSSKPKVAQFPLIFTGLPLLIIFTYPFANESEVINQWLIKIYEGGGILVALLMYGYKTYINKRTQYLNIFLGVVLLAISYGAYWFLQPLTLLQPWFWLVNLIGGIFFSYLGYYKILSRG